MESKLLWCEREADRTEGDKWRLPHWPITSSLGHTTLCYLQGPTWHFFCFSVGATQSKARRGTLATAGRSDTRWRFPQLTESFLAASWDSKIHSARNSRGHRIYHFITSTNVRSTTWKLLLTFTGASCAQNIWLTARSRVNMQYEQVIVVIIIIIIIIMIIIIFFISYIFVDASGWVISDVSFVFMGGGGVSGLATSDPLTQITQLALILLQLLSLQLTCASTQWEKKK